MKRLTFEARSTNGQKLKMADDHIIRIYSAADIEKYHKGLLSAKEMHAMEKAALDDPFLADAIEGYAVAGVNAEADIAELKKKLSGKMGKDGKVIPISQAGKSFPWLRAAVAIALIAGAAFLVYRLSFTNNKKDIAQAPVQKKEENNNKPITDTSKPVAIENKDEFTGDTKSTTTQEVSETMSNLVNVEKSKKNSGRTADSMAMPTQRNVSNNGNASAIDNTRNEQEMKKLAIDEKVNAAPASPVQTYRLNQASSKADSTKVVFNNSVNYSQDFKKSSAKQQKAKKFAYDQADSSKNGFFSPAPSNTQNGISLKDQQQKRMNIFRGRVTDSNKNALPYANITNTYDNVGTYSDVKGNFVLISPDSVLNVQVRSLGYADNNTQLNNTSAFNQVIMSEDRSLSPVVISKQKPNTNRSRTSNMVFEEPEPIDGWENYDTYLANNLRTPETLKTRQKVNGEVQLSFEINKDGEPVNITVDHSLCKSCDEEAIRLVKEGPKWKRKTKNGRISVTVNF